MRKFLAMIAMTAGCYYANAGSITIKNMTTTPMYLLNVQMAHTPAMGVPAAGYASGSGGLLIHPSVSTYFYASPGNLLTSLTGTYSGIPASDAYLSYALFHIGDTECNIGISYPNTMSETTCGGVHYTLTATTTLGTGNVVLTITSP